MNAFRVLLFTVVVGGLGSGLAAEQKGEQVQLPPFTEKFQWQAFTVTKDAPFSDNRHYRLKCVRIDLSVELIDCAVDEIATRLIIVRPMPVKLEDGDRPPTMVVVAADFQGQTATIRELRLK
jgi:hypothetical protein